MRDLADGDLSKVAGGQVPTYNAATGKFLPVTPAAPSSGTPSGTVVAEQTFGQSSGAGSSAAYSRGDHTHGTMVQPVVTFNTRAGAVTLTLADVLNALGYTPVNKAGDSGLGFMTGNGFGVGSSGYFYGAGSAALTFPNSNIGILLDGGGKPIYTSGGDFVVSGGGTCEADIFKSPGTPTKGGKLASRSNGHVVSFDWDGVSSSFYCVVDNTVVKTFIIDHPTDADRYLIHATLEGPENGVYYRGEGVLDDVRRATVTLPDYFEDLVQAEGITVLLTPIDDPVALAASRIIDGAFTVRGGAESAGVKFCWEVRAIRADVPDLDVEPLRSDVVVRGDGPYRYVAGQRVT